MAAIDNKIKLKYTGTNTRGRKVIGFLFCQDNSEATAILESQGIENIKLKKISGGFRNKIKSGDITLFTRQMATMLRSGLPLLKSFDMVADNVEKTTMRNLILEIKTDIENGSTFSEALKKHPKYFNDLYCSLIESGEISGKMDSMLDRIATYQEKSEIVRLKIRKALKYPLAVLIVASIVTVLLLVKVIPIFAELFKSFGSELPAFTQWVVDLSELVQKSWYVMLVVIIVAFFMLKRLFNNSIEFRHKLQRLSLKLPIFGEITYKGILARYCRTLSTTFASGVPMVDCIKAASKSTNNIVYTEAINDALEDILVGEKVNTAMKNTAAFPNMIIQMIAIGEESGTMDSMLEKAAEFYEEEVDTAVDGLTSMMEPLIMSFLAVVVGGLVIAMYLPIFTMGAAM